MKLPTCETCVYARKVTEDYGKTVLLLQCRRFPPDVKWLHPECEGKYVPYSWCGEHPDFPAWMEWQKNQPSSDV